MATYPHGIYMNERETSIKPPVPTTAGLSVFVGTAPLHLAANGLDNVNKPQLCYTYQEAVEYFGFNKDFENYTLCEAIYSHFVLFNVCPIVLINVLDPATHKIAVTETGYDIVDGIANLGTDVLKDSVVVKNGDTTVTLGTDYLLSYNSSGEMLVTVVEGGALDDVAVTSVNASFNRIDPAAVESGDIIGGVDINTGAYEGLELINSVYPMFRLLPGLLVVPKWGEDPAVAAVVKAKIGNINGCFECEGIVDIPSDSANADTYQKVAAWKNDNNYIDPLLFACWPKIALGDDVFRLSTQLASLIAQVDAGNEDIPYESPSNKLLQMNKVIRADGMEISLGLDIGNYLNGQGIVTVSNFMNGWKAWGNRTTAYPGNTDIKDAFIPNRRMLSFLKNQFILTFWNEVDQPMNLRLVNRIVNSWNAYLNGLTSREYILGGRIEFIEAENSINDLLDGKLTFHMWVSPPPPAEKIFSIVEFDPAYFSALWGA